MHRRSFLSAALLGLASLPGCASQYRVVTQASPDPFVNQRSFALAPIDYTGLRIEGMPEARYIAVRDQEDRKTFLGDKAAINDEFAKALTSVAQQKGIHIAPAPAGGAAAPFVIRPYVNVLEPGYLAAVSPVPSQLNLTIRITASDGRVLDEVRFLHRTPPPSPSTLSGQERPDEASNGGRWRADAREIGAKVAYYLASRVDP